MPIDVPRVFEEEDQSLRGEVLALVAQHLQREGLFAAATVLEDELAARLGAVAARRVKVAKLRQAVLRGDWDAAVALLSALVPRARQRCFLYFILRQQFLELVDNGEQDRAFPFLIKHLKPLEDIAVAQGSLSEVSEFKELCYLLTCSAIGEAEGTFFREWKHYYHQRELLADRLADALHRHIAEETPGLYSVSNTSGGHSAHTYLAQSQMTMLGGGGGSCMGSGGTVGSGSRLIDLLKQGFAYQVALQHGLSGGCEKSKNSGQTQSKQMQKVNEDTDTLRPPLPPIATHSLGCPEEKENSSAGKAGRSSAGRGLEESEEREQPDQGQGPMVEYPCVRRVLEDYQPASLPSSSAAHPPRAILTTGTTDNSAYISNSSSSCCGETLAALAFTSLASSAHSSSALSVVGGGSAGLLYGWRYDSSSSRGPAICYPVWSLNLATKRRGSSSGSGGVNGGSGCDHGPHRHSARIREVVCSPAGGGAGLVVASRSDGSLTLLRPSQLESRALPPPVQRRRQKQRQVERRGDESDGSDEDDEDEDEEEEEEGGGTYVKGYDVAGRVQPHAGQDAYALSLYPSGEYLLSGGFDKHVAVTDVQTLQTLKMFYGHTGAVTQVGCNRAGNLVYSSSRDGSVLFWDMLSGVSVRCLSPYSSNSSSQSLQTHSQYSTGRGYSQSFLQAPSPSPLSPDLPSSTPAASSSTGGAGSAQNNISGGASSDTYHPHNPFPSSAASTMGGEITSCSMSEDGKLLLVSSRFLPAKLIDLRTGGVLVKYKNDAASKRRSGHGSTSMFFRPSFCCKDQAVLGGAGPGKVSLWSCHSGALISTLSPPSSTSSTLSPALLRRLQASDFTRSTYDRYTGMTASISSAGVVLWG